MILFVVYPGPVISQGDFEHHWIGAPALMRLYGVRPDECVVLDQSSSEYLPLTRSLRGMLPRLMPLVPLSSGGYRKVTEHERATLRETGWWG